MGYRARALCLATSLALVLGGCAGSGVTSGDADTAPVPTTLPPANAAIGMLRLAGSNGERWYLDGARDDAANDLVPVTGHNAFWFAWSVFHPGTEVWEAEATNPATIQQDPSGQCTVPCDDIFSACPGRDCIPPLDSPTMVAADSPEAAYLADSDLVLGLRTSEGPRAYPHNILWWHEVANVEIGEDAFVITLCPLTGSGLRFDRRAFVPGRTVRMGVSGLLYNSNLVLWDRETESLWSQMRIESVSGPEIGSVAPLLPVLEMTWLAWRTLHPDTFSITNPPPDPQFQNKEMVSGVFVGDAVKGYVWTRLQERAGADQGVVIDEVGGTPIALVFHLPSRYVQAFEARAGGEPIDLELKAQ